MQGMTELACPVCATPYQAGAATCAFCGVSLLEPEAEAEPDTEAETPGETTAPVATTPEAGTHVADASGDIEAAPPDGPEPEPEPEPASNQADGVPANETPPPSPPDAGETAAAATDEPESGPEAESADPDASMDAPALAADLSAATQATGPRAPSFAKAPSAASMAQRRAQRIEWSVVGGLAALLLVQVVASDFDQLAASGTTRPWLQRACNVLHCTLPPWREPRALRMLQRDVRADPQRPGLLRISASFRNEARWAQPWPRMRVTLSDADGRAIAARDFAADEYLGAKPTTGGIASGQVASVAFDVADPSPRVTAFTFEFH
jgi:hypothetical protein